MNRTAFALFVPLLALAAGAAAAQTAKPAAAAPAGPKKGQSVQGIVSSVTDGDTLWLRPAEGQPIEVRLRDIDAPEICQPWGPEARKALEEQTLNKVATLQVAARDRFGRAVGTLTVADLNVGRHLVENGHAWSVRTRWDQGPLVKQETMARALSRGLHGLGGAVQPWVFRQNTGGCRKG